MAIKDAELLSKLADTASRITRYYDALGNGASKHHCDFTRHPVENGQIAFLDLKHVPAEAEESLTRLLREAHIEPARLNGDGVTLRFQSGVGGLTQLDRKLDEEITQLDLKNLAGDFNALDGDKASNFAGFLSASRAIPGGVKLQSLRRLTGAIKADATPDVKALAQRFDEICGRDKFRLLNDQQENAQSRLQSFMEAADLPEKARNAVKETLAEIAAGFAWNRN